ncbi:MAG TPA: DUF4350 domain-containing protein, partial [Planctomycetota bacterium]|nr:DUF4350 domain-containing protein [Planctomycetota bacterium]
MRGRTDGWLMLGLLVALVGGVLFLGAAGSKETDPFEIRRSTYLTTPHGAKALHDLVLELGYDARRHRGSLREVPPDTGTLCVLSPPLPFGQDEIRGVLSWVDSGGTLVLTLGGGKLAPIAAATNRGSPGGALAEAVGVVAVRWPASERDLRVVGPLLSMNDGAVDSVRMAGGRTLDGPLLGSPTFREIVRGPFGPVAGVAERGRGRIVVFADDTAFTNRLLRTPDNGMMAVLLLAHHGRKGPILFDERHQGYGADREAVARLAGALSETGLFLVLLQAGLAAGAFLYLAGRRFGAPLPPPRARRRSAAEAADALARAYRDAGGAATAAETLAAGARRRAAARLGIPPTLPPSEFAERARASRLPGAAALAAALERAARVEGSGAAADRELAEAARDLEEALAAA